MVREVVEAFEHDGMDFVLAPTQEQLVADVRVDAPGEALDVLGLQRAVVQEAARDQRRHQEQVHGVVAEIGHQHRVFLGHAHDIAEWMLVARKDAHALAVADHRGTVHRRDVHERRVRRLPQQ